MPDTRTVKKIFNWEPLTKRSQGRPKYRWEDNIIQGICQMKIKNWITCVQDRGKWKEVVEKANFQLGSSAPGRRRRYWYNLLQKHAHLSVACRIFSKTFIFPLRLVEFKVQESGQAYSHT